MKLSIVTINYKKPVLTMRCMSTLYKEYKKFFDSGEFELIIVDNASGDDSLVTLSQEIKRKQYPHVVLLESKINRGFGGGNNYGVANSHGEYLLFLNNDTMVGKGLNAMLYHMVDHPEVAILGGPLKNMDGTFQSSYGGFYFLPQVLLLLLGVQRFAPEDIERDEIIKVDWVKGALLMMRRGLFDQLGGFDEHIFMYTEDMELCYRAHLLGGQSYFYPMVDVLHEDQGSSNRTFAIVSIYTGIVYFYRKHRSAFEYQLVKLLLQTKAALLLLYGKLTKNAYLVTTYEEALRVTG